MMDNKMNSAEMNEKMNEGSDDKLQLHDSETTNLQAAVKGDSIATGSLTEVTSFSEHISTEDTELSLNDISVTANKPAEIPVDLKPLNHNPEGGVSRSVTICRPSYVKKEQPKPLCALLPTSMEACAAYDESQSFTSMSKSQGNLKSKSISVNNEPGEGDLCAAILLACLFCHPLDCIFATVRGCGECVCWLCSSLCGCKPAALEPLVEVTHQCDLCGCLGVRWCFSDCPICDICLQATECLDLAMEISQMLYH